MTTSTLLSSTIISFMAEIHNLFQTKTIEWETVGNQYTENKKKTPEERSDPL
jgi:hypothetical protein